MNLHFNLTGLLLATATLGLSAVAGCAQAGDSPTYPMTLTELAGDVRMRAFVLGEPGALGDPDDEPSVRRLVVTLERWHGNAGNAYKHCPTVPDVRAEVNGVEIVNSDPGGEYNDPFGCTLPSFSIDVDAIPGALDAAETVIEIRDASMTMRLEATNMFAAPKVTWKSPADGVVHAGDRVELAVTPSPLGLLSTDLFYEAKATETGSSTTHDIDTSTVEATPEALAFVVPEAPAGAGWISLSDGGRPIFGAGIVECKGPGSCAVERVQCADAGCKAMLYEQPLDTWFGLPATIVP